MDVVDVSGKERPTKQNIKYEREQGHLSCRNQIYREDRNAERGIARCHCCRESL